MEVFKEVVEIFCCECFFWVNFEDVVDLLGIFCIKGKFYCCCLVCLVEWGILKKVWVGKMFYYWKDEFRVVVLKVVEGDICV